MSGTCRLSIIIAVSQILVGFLPGLQADLVVQSRFSEVFYHTVNLTTGIPPDPPITQSISTTSLTAPFNVTLFETFSHTTVTGAFNTGLINVSQNSTISPTSLFADTSQSGFVTTTFNHPAIYTRSRFFVDFQVTAPLEIILTGLIQGSSIVGHPDFARVLLLQNNGPIFNTAFGHSFPFNFTLMPGNLYNLQVESSGTAFLVPPFTFEDTSSRAQAHLVVIPEPGTLILIGIVTAFLYLGSSSRKKPH